VKGFERRRDSVPSRWGKGQRGGGGPKGWERVDRVDMYYYYRYYTNLCAASSPRVYLHPTSCLALHSRLFRNSLLDTDLQEAPMVALLCLVSHKLVPQVCVHLDYLAQT